MNKNTLRAVVIVGLFTIPFIPFLVSSSLFFPFITTKAFTFRAIVEVVFAAWLLLALLEPDYRPKKSGLMYAFLGFMLAAFLADIFGVSPVKSFWSNFERMEGFMLILHIGALFTVMGAVFREIEWKRWWNTSLIAAFLMVLYCSLQLLGVKQINQGGVRVDGTFGNAIYLAVYMLFHIFIALFYLAREWKQKNLRWLYGISMVTNALILYFTATRGTILGLLGGLAIFALLNIRNRENVWARKAALGVVGAFVIIIGSFFAFRQAAFVQNSPVLSRFANVSLAEVKGQGRYYIWPMALEGIKDHPVLGWGQENFTYVFEKYYRPEMYNLEPWFDRAHNVFLDWAIAGGLVTLALYLSLYVFALIIIWKRGSFTYLEKSVLVSLLAAYFFHNLFVFDHLFSYVFFFSFLAYLQSRSASEPIWKGSLSPAMVQNVALPTTIVLFGTCFYFVIWQPLVANTSLIQALIASQSKQPAVAIASFERAYNSSALGRPEEVEQMVTHATEILSSSLPVEEKNAFYAFANNAVRGEADLHVSDVRANLLAGMFIVETGSVDEGISYLKKAESLAPKKQEIYFQIVSAFLSKGDAKSALPYLKTAYELAPEYSRARSLYLVGAIYANDRVLEATLRSLFTEHDLALDDMVVNAYYATKRTSDVVALLELRKKFDPANAAAYDDYIKQVLGQ